MFVYFAKSKRKHTNNHDSYNFDIGVISEETNERYEVY